MSEFTHGVAVASGTDRPPDSMIDAVGNRPGRTIDQSDLDDAGVVAARCDDGVTGLAIDPVAAFLPRVVVAVVGRPGVHAGDSGIRRQRCCDALMMHAAVRPFGVSRVLKVGRTCDDGLRLGDRSRSYRRWRASIAAIGSPRFDFAEQQRVAGPVGKGGKSEF